MVTCVTSYSRHSREPVILSSCSPTMSNNHQWYHQNNQQYPRNDGRQRQPDRQGAGYAGTPPDAVQNGQRLLAVYPPASATPTHHGKTFFFWFRKDMCIEIYGIVSRHISNMTLTAAPTFPQTQYYNDQGSTYPQGNPPPYSEYDQQLRYLSSSNVPADDSGYWENTRNDAVRMLNEQAGPYVLNTRI